MRFATFKTLLLAATILSTSARVALAERPHDAEGDVSPEARLLLDQAFQAAETARLALEERLQSPLEFSEFAPTPAQQAIDSLSRLQSEIRREARHHAVVPLQASPEALTFCIPTRNTLCLGGRFIVSAAWDSPYDSSGAYLAGAIAAGPQSGLLYFIDPTNFEVVIKVLNGNCFSSPANPWVFIAGLTNFGVVIEVRDAITGVTETYVNNTGNVFGPVQDQFTSFPCF